MLHYCCTINERTNQDCSSDFGSKRLIDSLKVYGLSKRNGLVNGYLNGYISRPKCVSTKLTFSYDVQPAMACGLLGIKADGP